MKFFSFFATLVLLTSPVSVLAHGEENHIELLPSSMVYEAGQEFSMAVMLHAQESATSFAAHISYDQESLQVAEITPDEESFPLWRMQEAADGVIQLEAYAPAPGVMGEVGVAVVIFEALESGSSEFMVQGNALVLNTENRNILLPIEQPEQTEEPAAQQPDTPAAQTESMAMALLLAGAAVIVVGGALLFLLLRKK